MNLIWDETKRKANLIKHGLDFRDADEVLASRYRWDAEVVRGGENSDSVDFLCTGLSGGADGGAHRAQRCNARHHAFALQAH